MDWHAAQSGADVVVKGVVEEVEDLMPDYEILESSDRWKDWDGSIIFSSRGCNRRCPFCAVWRIEGPVNSCRRSIKELVYEKHKRIIFWDNNFLQNPYWPDPFYNIETTNLQVYNGVSWYYCDSTYRKEWNTLPDNFAYSYGWHSEFYHWYVGP